MKSYQSRLGLFAIATIAFMSTAQARADVEGIWLDKDGGTVRIRNCGDGVCGSIATVNPRIDPATGLPWTDKKNADPGLRSRPLVGVPVLISMRPSGPRKWSGRLYNADNGKTYSGNLIELGPQTIRVEGCVLGICGGESLTRMR